jgi:hypothetical protein
VSGQSLWSSDGAYKAAMQTDGNFVVYAAGGKAIFASGTGGVGAATLVMQTDGNLVIYAGGRAVWNSGTGGNSGSAVMQTDGNLVIYVPGAGALWASQRARGATSGTNRFYAGYCTWGAAEEWKSASGSYPGFTGDAYPVDQQRSSGWLQHLNYPATTGGGGLSQDNSIS